MLSNLMLCNDIVAERQAANPGDKSDFAGMLHEEWLKLYPHSTLIICSSFNAFTMAGSKTLVV